MSGAGSEAIGIAGAGRLAQAFGHLLRERGEPVVAVASRRHEHAQTAASFIGGDVRAVAYDELPRHARRWLIAVADDAIPAVAAALASAAEADGVALHTCGAQAPAVLAPLARRGVACGVLHPLQTVPSPSAGVGALPGGWFGICGDPPALAWARRIIALLGGHALEIAPEQQALYHAGAVMASNFLASLLDAAASLMRPAGLPRDRLFGAIAPLAGATLENVVRLGPERALTGPIARGDIQTVRAHLAALAGASEPLRDLYRAAARYTVEVARRAGLDPAGEQQLLELLHEPGP